MSNTPSKFESLLAEDAARKYMAKRFSRRKLAIEVTGPSTAFTALIGEDMIHFNELRVEIRKALADEHESAQAKAIYWISFLKPRIEALEYQSAIRSSFAAYLSAATALLALGLNAFGSPVAAGTAAATGLLLAMYSSLRRVLIDRRRAWYKYLVAHLEAIKNVA
jgi:methionine synthase II (cobalamin-independent)